MIKTSSKVRQVILYPKLALVKRFVKENLFAGRQELVITGIGRGFFEDSLRVAGIGTANFKIKDIKVKPFRFDESEDDFLIDLKKRIEEVSSKIKRLESSLEILETQKTYVNSLGNTEKSENIGSPNDWQNVYAFMGKKLDELSQKYFQFSDELSDLHLEKAKLVKERDEYLKKAKRSQKAIHLDLELTEDAEVAIELNYMINQAFWRPLYDVYVDSETKALSLTYHAEVIQRTDEDWNDVSLVLSTAQAQVSGSVPELSPCRLDIYRPRPKKPMMRKSKISTGSNMRKEDKKMESFADIMEEEEFDEIPEIEMEMQEMEVVEKAGASVEFKARGKNNVPGDGSPSKVFIMEAEMPTEFEYSAVPSLSDFVYLTCETQNTTDYPFLLGEIHIYVNQIFVGKSRMKQFTSANEKFKLSLGIDENVKVKKERIDYFRDEKGLFSKNITVRNQFKITLTNNKKTTERFVIKDNMPIAMDDKIKVKLTKIDFENELTKNEGFEKKGFLEWKFELESQENKNISYEFIVEYPNDVRIDGI